MVRGGISSGSISISTGSVVPDVDQLEGGGDQAVGVLPDHVHRKLQVGGEGIVVVAADDGVLEGLGRQVDEMAQHALEGGQRVDEQPGRQAAQPVAQRGDLAGGAAGGVAAGDDLVVVAPGPAAWPQRSRKASIRRAVA